MSGCTGTLWNPFQASIVDISWPASTLLARSNGVLLMWVCLEQAVFSFEISTTRRGSPLCLATTCMGAHHSCGVLHGTLNLQFSETLDFGGYYSIPIYLIKIDIGEYSEVDNITFGITRLYTMYSIGSVYKCRLVANTRV